MSAAPFAAAENEVAAALAALAQSLAPAPEFELSKNGGQEDEDKNKGDKAEGDEEEDERGKRKEDRFEEERFVGLGRVLSRSVVSGSVELQQRPC